MTAQRVAKVQPGLVTYPKDLAVLVRDGEKTLLVRSEPVQIGNGHFQLVSEGLAYAAISLGPGVELSLADFAARADEHKISDAQRAAWWPNAQVLYGWPIVHVSTRYDPPARINVRGGAMVELTRIGVDGAAADVPVDEAFPPDAPVDPAQADVAMQADRVTMAAPPTGVVPALKALDPLSMVARLRAGTPTGLLLREPPPPSAANPHALVNDVPPSGRVSPAVFGVVSMHGHVAYAHIGAMPDDVRTSIDPATLAEFGAVSPVHYCQIRLLIEFDPPLLLKQAVQGLRMGGQVDFDRDLVRKSEADDAAVAFAKEPDTAALSQMTDDGVHGLDLRLHALFSKLFSADNGSNQHGLSREDVANAHAFVVAEMQRRGRSHDLSDDLSAATHQLVKFATDADDDDGLGDFASLSPSGDAKHAGDPVTLQDVVAHYDKPIALRKPAVYVVGSLPSNGKSENDIDLLIRGPFDDDTLHAIKVRLGRALPPGLSDRVSFLTDTMGGPISSHVPLYDLVLVPHADRSVVQMADLSRHQLDKVMSVIAQAAPDRLMDYPDKRGPRPATVQLHFRGKSVHADLRMALTADELVGWTLAVQRAGMVPDVDTVAQGRAVARQFDVDGSAINKPLALPGRVLAVPKKPQPIAWLDIADVKFEPGEVGATAEQDGVLIEVARPKAQWGLQKAYAHEYFLTGDDRFAGLLFFRLVDDGSSDPYWVGQFTKSALPSVLKPRAVATKSMPPLGQSALPVSLMDDVPSQYRYWLADTEAEARETRDALVKARIFTDHTVGLVDGQFALGQFARKADPKRMAAAGPPVASTPSDRAERVIIAAMASLSALASLSKAHSVRPDGTQVWDLERRSPDDDKGGDRAMMQPPAIFAPMKAPARKSNVFGDADDAAAHFLSDEQSNLLDDGVQVEPKLNGFRTIVQRWAARPGVDAGSMVFTDGREDITDAIPGLVSDLQRVPADFVLDGEMMAVDASGGFVPRRDLAQFRTAGGGDGDKDVRFVVFDALYLPGHGNLTQMGQAARRRALEQFYTAHLRGVRRVMLIDRRVARSRGAMRSAIKWAAAQPGSEGAMLKQVSATYSLGGENDLWAKVKMTRVLRAIVLDRHEVSGSPGVYNFTGGIGPLSKDDAADWRPSEVRSHAGKLYVVIGVTGNRKLSASIGDVIEVQTLEFAHDSKPPKRIRWFGPAQAMDVVDGQPSSVADVIDMLRPDEVKKLDTARDDRAIRLLKRDDGDQPDERYVFGVVLVPGETDAQGDAYTADEVRKACHAYMEHFGHRVKIMHKGQAIDGVKVLENYVTKLPEQHGDETFPAGTWMLAVRVEDDTLWEAVKRGEFTGFSMGGTAIRDRLRP